MPSACPVLVPVPLGRNAPIRQLSLPARQVPGNFAESSGQTQAHPSYFSSPATVVDVFISVTRGCFRTSLLLLATRASPQLSFLGDALNALFPGQPVKCLLFMAMPKIPVNIYEPICHGFSYDGKKSVFLLIDAIAHSTI